LGASIATLLAFVADDIVLHASGRHSLAGEFIGKRAFLDAYWA
jgi:hypothetical protein